MKLATTTGDFRDRSTDKSIRGLRSAGFRYIDLSLYDTEGTARWMMGDKWEAETDRLGKLADYLGMRFVQSHAPGGNPLLEEGLEKLTAVIIRAIEVCGRLGIPNTVVHSGCLPGISYEEFVRRNLDFYRKLYPVMERTGVEVLIENSTRANLRDQAFFYTGEEMREFLEMAGHPLLGACWDTGHANCEGHQYSDLTALGPYLKAVHINDNRGTKDEHLIPFCGTCCFDEVMRGLIDASFGGPFTLECSSTLRPGKYWLGDRRTFGEDTRLAEPSPELFDAAEKLLYLAGKRLLDAYGLFEG